MLTPILILGIVFIGIAFIPNEKNSEYLLAGYNTMSKEERQKFNLKAFLTLFKRFHLFLGVSYILIGLCLLYFIDEDLAGFFMVYYPILLYIVFICKTLKFHSSAKGNLASKVGIGIMLAVLIGLLGLFYAGYRENKISINEKTIKISGIYGEEILFSAIETVEITETLPEITYKANGFALGTISKGYFGTKTEGYVKFILNTNQGPFLYILKADNSKVYYSSTGQDIKQLSQEIKKRIANFK